MFFFGFRGDNTERDMKIAGMDKGNVKDISDLMESADLDMGKFDFEENERPPIY